ncbi:MAG TPA: flagellar motor protein MotD [Burkholderiaceae bacterium]|nr:flagellar motor protein MotD [Burkholderiaceae bacterium]
MARKKHEDEADNHERWLVSYADFMTLLFAFFVVMYAVSSINEGKYRVLSNALGSAFGQAHMTPLVPPGSTQIPPQMPARPMQLGIPKPHNSEALRREKERMTAMARSVLGALAPLVKQGKVRVTQSSRGVKIEINASVLFAPGEAKLTPESIQALIAVAAVLKDGQHVIQVEGHTDTIPIATALFPSNWELSAVRAGSVVRLFIDHGVDKQRLTALGYGDTRPVDANDTPEQRQRNRRVEVVILSSLPETVTELPVSPSEGS